MHSAVSIYVKEKVFGMIHLEDGLESTIPLRLPLNQKDTVLGSPGTRSTHEVD